MKDCIFCKIIKWEIPWDIFWEDSKHVALLDVFPNCYGQTLVIPKQHISSEVFEMNDEKYMELMLASKKVATILKNKLGVQRVGMIMEGMWVNHAHIKLYPMHWLDKVWTPNEDKKRAYFEKYPWYLCTFMGELIAPEEAKKIAKKLQ